MIGRWLDRWAERDLEKMRREFARESERVDAWLALPPEQRQPLYREHAVLGAITELLLQAVWAIVCLVAAWSALYASMWCLARVWASITTV